MPVRSKKYNDIITGETFKFVVEPEPSNDISYIINTEHVQLYRQHTKCYLYDHGDTAEIDPGAFNTAVQAIAGLSDESAADKIKIMFRSGAIKVAPAWYDTLSHARKTRFHPKAKQHRVTKQYGSNYKY